MNGKSLMKNLCQKKTISILLKFGGYYRSSLHECKKFCNDFKIKKMGMKVMICILKVVHCYR